MISIRDIWRSAATRYLPGCVLGFIAAFLANGIPSQQEVQILLMVEWPYLLGLTVVPALSYGVTLIGVRRRLMEDVRLISGRASVAGLLGGVVLTTVTLNWPIRNLPMFWAAGALAGSWSSLAIFFPWLRTRADVTGLPESTQLSAIETVERAIDGPSDARGPGRMTGTGDPISIHRAE